MNKRILSYLSNGTLIIGAAIGIYTLIDIYFIKGRLVSGTCTVTSSRPQLFAAIILCGISFILSFLVPGKKQGRQTKGDESSNIDE